MSVKERLLGALASQDEAEFFELVSLQTPRDDSLKEAFEVLSKEQCAAFWKLAFDVCLPMVEKLEGCNVGFGYVNPLLKLKSVLSAALVYLDSQKHNPSELFDFLFASHKLLTGIGFEEDSQASAVKLLLAKICERWWMSGFTGADELMPQLITFFLISSLDINGKGSMIKRLLDLRGSFLLLDFDDPSIEFIKGLILRSFVHPSFLKLREGQKLLSFFLKLNNG